MTTLSIRRLWALYNWVSVAHVVGSSRRDLALAHGAFYSGARGVLKVLAYMIERVSTMNCAE